MTLIMWMKTIIMERLGVGFNLCQNFGINEEENKLCKHKFLICNNLIFEWNYVGPNILEGKLC